jgi:GT2 family glycosyltransferase
MTDISIIVVSYRGWDRLTKCLDSLNKFKGDRFSFEVIVVDNNSRDDILFTLERKYSTFKFIKNTINGGYANGNNLGARHASGEYILILNPDTVATETEIERMLIISGTHPEYSIISCRQVNENGKLTASSGEFPRFGNLTGFQRSVAGLFKRKSAARDSDDGHIVFPDWISGSVVWIKSDLYRKLNGFYEGFWMYYEDVDICKRVTTTGGKVALLMDVTIEHNHGGSSRVDIRTASVTKTEVHVSRHLYVSRNMKGAGGTFIQLFLVLNNLISGFLMALIGLLFFYIPKLLLRTLIYLRLIRFYFRALLRKSWISPLSVLANPSEC